MGPYNNKVKEKEKKVAINGYGLFVWEGRKMKYGLFLWDGGSILFYLFQIDYVSNVSMHYCIYF